MYKQIPLQPSSWPKQNQKKKFSNFSKVPVAIGYWMCGTGHGGPSPRGNIFDCFTYIKLLLNKPNWCGACVRYRGDERAHFGKSGAAVERGTIRKLEAGNASTPFSRSNKRMRNHLFFGPNNVSL